MGNMFLDQQQNTTPTSNSGNMFLANNTPGVVQSSGNMFLPIDETPPDNQEKTIGDIVGNVASTLVKPASLAVDAISYFDKPRGAIAGTVKAAQEGTDLWEGAKKGWQENTSWKETFNQDWVKENPTAAAVLGFAADVVGDPAILITPAKIAKALRVPEAAGAVKTALGNTEAGRAILAKAEDFAGVNRVADPLAEFKAGRASDQVLGQDVIDEINAFKKVNPDQAENITKYVEAANRGDTSPVNLDSLFKTDEAGNLVEAQNILGLVKKGKLSKEQAFNAYRDSGQEIPNWLLQEHQRVALQGQGEALKSKVKDLQEEIMIARSTGETDIADKWTQELKALKETPKDYKNLPQYQYRDEVLDAIPDEAIRKQVQALGDRIAKMSEKYSNDLLASGRLSDEQYVRFMGGSHLRRSFAQYEKPEEFLAAVKKNGTPEEWQRVYADYQTMKNSNAFGATHKVNMKDFTGRQVLSDETMAKMGIINDPAYKAMDTFNRGSKALREDEFLSKVDQMFGKTEQEAALLSRGLPSSREYIPIPDSKGFGALAGKWVPRDVANQVMGTLGQKPDNINETWGKLISWWKVGKLANPASVMRNFYSGLPMANIYGQVPFQSLPKHMAMVTQQFAQAGKNAPLIRELRETGILGNIWNKQELGNIIGENPKGIKKLADIGMEAFGAPDKFWRAVVYSYHRAEGKSVKDAAKMANRALLDYSSAPEWVSWLSKSGAMPFARFPFLAGKETARALWNNPAQVTKFIKPMNQTNTEDREQIMPEYMRARQYLPLGEGTRIVNGKEQKVARQIDLGNTLPFTTDVKFGNPLVEALMVGSTGRNSLGMDVLKPGMTGGEKTQAFLKSTFGGVLPTVVSPYTVEKLYNAAQGNVDSKGRQYDMTDALLQTVGGIKQVPVNMDEMYKQKMGGVKREQLDIQARMREIVRDNSLSQRQKEERLADHKRQLKNLGIEAKQTREAYAREKKKGGN
jgi:hypothetical protein